MVSQPDYNHSSLALRGPASVVSARSSSRQHVSSRSKRYNRSHAGGTSYIAQNEFPVFSHSGDVEILISAGGKENRYLLHRHTLTRCSGFFEASMSQEWSKASVLPPLPELQSRELARIGEENGSSISNGGAEVARPGMTSPTLRRRWRYELDPGTGGDDIPMLVQKEANSSSGGSSGAPANPNSIFGGGSATANTPVSRTSKGGGHSHTHSTSSFFRSVANLSLAPTSRAAAAADLDSQPLSQADADLLRDYDNLFRIFYNYPPVLDGISIADAYVQCKSLLTLADQYDALAVAGPRVDHHLLQFQSRLWKQIAKYPISYLRLGYLSRSKVIFQEALIHVVGQWPAGERSIRHSFPEIVLDIIEDKVDELEETVSRIEGRLFRLSLTNSRGERVTPQSSYLDWLAVSLFRQWLADNTAPAPQPPPPPPPTSSSRHHHHHSSRDHSSCSAGGSNSNSNTAAAVIPPPTLANVGRTYRTLGGVSGYLGHDECKRFLKLTPDLYSRDNLRRFEKRIEELKGAARDVVRPLMGSGLELELERGSVGVGAGGAGSNEGVGGGNAGSVVVGGMMSYLTCVRVLERDLPWEVEG
ncbi:Uu.00g066740.m01.CDS01 [Anthostomella pinea]|uniref:Uu.00g066740.m01.CDS01 n=1 Tax=Anthostomella pinea TaxID=933095 RepID=A0AAI8VU16_9PEZI|nr:Uu.00g066740.m01.CDS01 [Anthostomella pinea]